MNAETGTSVMTGTGMQPAAATATCALEKLYVLYDSACGMCCRARDWMQEQPKFIELSLLPAGSRAARMLFPDLYADEAGAISVLAELTVIDDSGGVYRGGEAWVMCFYALKAYRALAIRMSQPELLPLARNAFSLISRSRLALSDVLGLANDSDLARQIRSENVVQCVPGGPQLRVAKESWLW